MPVKVCAISFPTPIKKTLAVAHQFELASFVETQMTVDLNVQLFDFQSSSLEIRDLQLDCKVTSTPSVVSTSEVTSGGIV